MIRDPGSGPGHIPNYLQSFRAFLRIQKFVILNEDLSIENGCMTPTMKIKRAKVYEKFAEDIAKLYQD